MAKIGRNQPCPCGSGRKYKRCCWPRDRAARVPATPAELSQGYHWAETDLDRLSNSVVRLVDEGRLDEAELAIEYCDRTIAWMDANPEDFDPGSREPYRKDIERLRGSFGGAC